MGEEIFGSYEKSLTELRTIMGHNNTIYMVGGNARFYLKSGIQEWELSSKMDIKSQIKIINQILNISPQIIDPDDMYIFLLEINKLSGHKFIKFMEKSMKLYEPIEIQLRKLFYTILDKFTDGGKNDKYHTEFCKYEPLYRINTLLNTLDQNDLKMPISNENYQKIYNAYNDIKNIIESKNDETFTHNPNIDSKSNLTSLMDFIIKSYKLLFPILKNIERKNIKISKNIEIISDVVLQSINII